jgi:probable HAF family extracellular repeat protein
MQDLGTLGGRSSWAQGINEDGVIVGWSETAAGNEHAVMWKNGRIIDLGRQARAHAINADGVKAGFRSGGDANSLVWRFRRSLDLPTLGRPGGAATDINDRGQIVGSSIRRDIDEHAVLWRPE